MEKWNPIASLMGSPWAGAVVGLIGVGIGTVGFVGPPPDSFAQMFIWFKWASIAFVAGTAQSFWALLRQNKKLTAGPALTIIDAKIQQFADGIRATVRLKNLRSRNIKWTESRLVIFRSDSDAAPLINETLSGLANEIEPLQEFSLGSNPFLVSSKEQLYVLQYLRYIDPAAKKEEVKKFYFKWNTFAGVNPDPSAGPFGPTGKPVFLTRLELDHADLADKIRIDDYMNRHGIPIPH